MTDRCEAEMCPFWTGEGCACAMLDLDASDRAKARAEQGLSPYDHEENW